MRLVGIRIGRVEAPDITALTCATSANVSPSPPPSIAKRSKLSSILRSLKKYFTLTDVSYEQTVVKPKEKKPKTKPKTNEGGTPPENGGHVGA